VCVCVCVCVCFCRPACLRKLHVRSPPDFTRMIPIARARSSSVDVSIRYVGLLSVLWMVSFLHAVSQMVPLQRVTSLRRRAQDNAPKRRVL